MKIYLFFLASILSSFLFGQSRIILKEQLKVVSNEKISPEINKNTTLLIGGVVPRINSITLIVAQTETGEYIYFDPKMIHSFTFKEIDNIQKVWDKNLLLSGTYENIVTQGLQYEKRNELEQEAILYMNALRNGDRLFKDDFFEDYLYTLVNKIHVGILSDKRPGNIQVKVIKDSQPQAFILPNGSILLSTGLLSTIQSEDELIAVLAHEIAHFVLDHHILNYNKELDLQKKAEFWSTFATVAAASADVFLTAKNKNHIPGVLTATTAIASSVFAESVISKLGAKYSKQQERDADQLAQEVLTILGYDNLAMSAILKRIMDYSIKTGNYLSLSGGDTHPTIESRIARLGEVKDFDSFEQPNYLKKASAINSYNAWIELWFFSHHIVANNLATRNIENNVGVETDYIVKAVVLRRLSNTKESNLQALNLLKKAKTLNVEPTLILNKELALTYIRLEDNNEAKNHLNLYLSDLKSIKNFDESIQIEISWANQMIYKVDNLIKN